MIQEKIKDVLINQSMIEAELQIAEDINKEFNDGTLCREAEKEVKKNETIWDKIINVIIKD